MSGGEKRVLRTVESLSFSLPKLGLICYEGTWQSGGYPRLIAHGSVAAEVNYETKTANILLRYDGVFMKGTLRQLKTKMETDANDAKSASSYVFRVSAANGNGVGAKRQSLEFTATLISKAEIKGTYKSFKPQDSGPFEMKAVSPERFKEFAQESGACTIQ